VADVSDATTVRYRESLERELADRTQQLDALRSQIAELEQAAAAIAKECEELNELLDHVKGREQ